MLNNDNHKIYYIYCFALIINHVSWNIYFALYYIKKNEMEISHNLHHYIGTGLNHQNIDTIEHINGNNL